jgi:hypothetical protein
MKSPPTRRGSKAAFLSSGARTTPRVNADHHQVDTLRGDRIHDRETIRHTTGLRQRWQRSQQFRHALPGGRPVVTDQHRSHRVETGDRADPGDDGPTPVRRQGTGIHLEP